MRMAEQINKQFESSELIKYINEDVSCIQLKKLIQHEIKPFHANVRIVRDLDPKKSRIFMTSGVYDPNRISKNNITVYLHFSKSRKYIHLTKSNLEKLIFIVSQILQHEMIHRSSTRWKTHRIKVQYSNAVSKKIRNDIKYLTDRDEIDAYAHDIAMEIKQYYSHRSISEVFNKIGTLKKLQSYRAYSETFFGLDWTDVRKELLKKVWKWLPLVIPQQKIGLAK